MMIGVPGDDIVPDDVTDSYSDAGSVFIFERDAGDWIPAGELVAEDAAIGDQFGSSIQISDDVAVIRSREKLYIYRKNGSWDFEQAIDLGLPPFAGNVESFSVSEGVLVMGAPSAQNSAGFANGLVYIYRSDGTHFVYEQTLEQTIGGVDIGFGSAIAIDGDRIVISAPGFDHFANGQNSGATYVYEFGGVEWAQSERILASDAQAYDRFGTALSIDGDTILVSQGVSGTGNPEKSVYFFELANAGWAEQARFYGNHMGAWRGYGNAIDLENDWAAVGAYRDVGSRNDNGAVYVYRRENGAWAQNERLTLNDFSVSSWDAYGWDLAISGSQLVVTAPGYNAGVYYDSGLIDMHSLGCDFDGCLADLTGDGSLDIFDVFAYLDLFTASDLAADFTSDGKLNIFDVFAYLDVFNAGCP